MRRGTRITLILAVCLVLAFSTVSLAAVKTLTMYHAFTSNTLEALKGLIADFEAEHPGIKVKPQFVGDALMQKLQAAVAAKDPPDLAWTHGGEYGVFAQTDTIYKMEDFIRRPDGLSDEDLDDFFPVMKTYCEYNYDDQWWVLPVNATTITFVYNADMFAAAGIDPENPGIETWEDFAVAAGKLSDPQKGIWGFHIPVYTGGMAGYFDWIFRPFIWAAGGKYISDDLQSVAFDSPEAKEAVRFFYDLMHKHKGGTISPADQAFNMGKVAITLDGPWSIPQFEKLRFPWRAMLYPVGPSGKRYHPSAGEPVAIFKDAKHPEEAWLFVKFWMRPDNMAKWAIASGYLPTRRSVLDDPVYVEHIQKTPGLEYFVKGLEYGTVSEYVPSWNKVIDTYAAAVELIMNNKVTLDKGLEDAAAKANEAIQTYWQDYPEEYEEVMSRLPGRAE